jgi:ABC-type transport system involved in cytochrome c biogenesis permease subunit
MVWLNCGAWLHMRLMKSLCGAVSAWWALLSWTVPTFAFFGGLPCGLHGHVTP